MPNRRSGAQSNDTRAPESEVATAAAETRTHRERLRFGAVAAAVALGKADDIGRLLLLQLVAAALLAARMTTSRFSGESEMILC